MIRQCLRCVPGTTASLILLLATAPADLPAAARQSPRIEVKSPDGRVRFMLFQRDGRLHYDVAFKGRAVVEASPLGIVVDGANLSPGASTGSVETYKGDETYAWYGVHAAATNRFNGARIPARHDPSGTAYSIEARAFNDGIAFRFVVPGGGNQSRVPDAVTSFTLPAGSHVWVADLNRGHYEEVQTGKDVSEVAAGEWAAPPLTVKLPGGLGYASITEAALTGYAGMALQGDGRRGFHVRLGHAVPASYPFALRYKDDVERLTKAAPVTGTITTPWRVIMIGADLNALVNSDIVHDLAAPPDPALFPQGIKTDWIKPGRAVWKYLDGGGENTLEEMKNFSRLAGELGFEYNLIEGFWQKWTPEQLRELVDYSRQRGVGIWLWKHSRDLRDPGARAAFFKICRDAGAVGVKVDFFDHEAKEVIDRYDAILRGAAESRLLVNFHGANKPTGQERTWPNELTREAIFGLEYRRAETRARHEATVPFTRFLAGAADYTPVIFGERKKDTTWAHQIATAAVFTSPLMVYGAHPASLLENPAVDVIKSLPSVWDETMVLPMSEIGEVAAFARRRGTQWFVAILNGPSAKTLRVPLEFLPDGPHRATLVRDKPETAEAVNVETGEFTRRQTLEIAMNAGGGFVGRFTR